MAIGFTGSILPVAAGMGISTLAGSASIKAAVAIGASFAPTSLGVAASALSKGGVNDTPVGQLIIAACVIDDVIGLILLSMLQILVKDDAKLIEYFIPLISSFGFLFLLGFPAVTFLPSLIQSKYIRSFSIDHRPLAGFCLLTVLVMAYMPLMNYTEASYLSGVFLAGATFSQVDHAYDTFVHSSHSVMGWLLRVFFAATIGFQVPLKSFGEPFVILNGLAFWGVCVCIKFTVAFFVPRFEEVKKDALYDPHKRDVLVTGLAMTCRGEFSFIIASFALGQGVISTKTYASIVFAVLFSAVTSPFMLLQCIKYFKKLQKKQLAMTCPITNGSDGKIPLHFCISLETQNKWYVQNAFIIVI